MNFLASWLRNGTTKGVRLLSTVHRAQRRAADDEDLHGCLEAAYAGGGGSVAVVWSREVGEWIRNCILRMPEV